MLYIGPDRTPIFKKKSGPVRSGLKAQKKLPVRSGPPVRSMDRNTSTRTTKIVRAVMISLATMKNIGNIKELSMIFTNFIWIATFEDSRLIRSQFEAKKNKKQYYTIEFLYYKIYNYYLVILKFYLL